MNLWRKILQLSGWSVDITAPYLKKCVICVAPHTSNWDFFLGLAAYKSLGRKANFLMKSFWFFFPLKYLLKALGGIPVVRSEKRGSLTEKIIELFKTREYVNLAVTPEGTRDATERWKTGFLYIAYGADVPILLGAIDYQNKRIIIKDQFQPSGNVDEDMKAIKAYYSKFNKAGKFPEKFKI